MRIKSTLAKCLIITAIISIVISSNSVASATEKIKVPDQTIKSGFAVKIKINNPDCAKITVKSRNKKVAKPIGKTKNRNGKTIFKIKGLKKGSTAVDIFSQGKKAGCFSVDVFSADASIKNSCKKTVLKHNSHGSNVYMDGCHIQAEELVKKHHPNGKYTALSEDYNIVNHTNDGLIYTVNKGRTKVTIYEKIGKQTPKAIGKVIIKVKDTDMAYVARENLRFYPYGIFGKGNKYEVIHLDAEDNVLSMQDRIKECLINNIYTGSSFKKSDYTIKYHSTKPDVAVVDKNGNVTGIKEGFAKIKFTIKFSDKSVLMGRCYINVQKSTTV